jgi:hypothetical protein
MSEWAVRIDIQGENSENQSISPRTASLSRIKCGIGCSYVINMFSVFFDYEWLPRKYRLNLCAVSLFLHIASIITSLVYTTKLKDGGLIFLCCFPETIFIVATLVGCLNGNVECTSGIKIVLCVTGFVTKLMVISSIFYIMCICSVITLFFYYTYYRLKELLNRDVEIQPVISDEILANIRSSIEASYRISDRNLQIATRIQNQFLINEYYEKSKLLETLEINKITYICKSLFHQPLEEPQERCPKTDNETKYSDCQECLCCVCMESQNNQEVYKFKCNHTMHKECMIEFISRNKLNNMNCPLCRQKI